MSIPIPKILKLDETVINRIAAGEVVQKPSAALKELLENSIDAKATQIIVNVKGGGLQCLEIKDNGHGIRKEDLKILCERFTTSKLKTFDDLKSISTYGFRGEALSSITHVAHVTITTKTASSPCAYKSKYSDGKMVPIKSHGPAEPQAVAGTNGTSILVEDLFYNMSTRKQAFKNPNEQYQKILDVMTRYAIHFGERNISFICKRIGQNSPDLSTPQNSNLIENIRITYGSPVSKELLDLDFQVSFPKNVSTEISTVANNSLSEADYGIQVKGKISNSNFSNKKSIFILFINDRLVECNSIRKAIESIYANILPKHSFPFIYLSLSLPPEIIDVNIHPTKKEVRFLFEDEIIVQLHTNINILLSQANESRTFYSSASLVGKLITSEDSNEDVADNSRSQQNSQEDFNFSIEEDKDLFGSVEATEIIEASSSSELPTTILKSNDVSSKKRKVNDIGNKYSSKTTSNEPSYRYIRTDYLQQPIDFYYSRSIEMHNNSDDEKVENNENIENIYCLNVSASSPMIRQGQCNCCEQQQNLIPAVTPSPAIRLNPSSLRKTIELTKCEYTSIQTLLQEIESSQHASLQSVLKQIVFVGVINDTFSLVQYKTKLFVMNHSILAKHLFYQLVIKRFQVLPRKYIDKIPLKDLLLESITEHYDKYVSIESSKTSKKTSRQDIPHLIEKAINILCGNADMLLEYFSIGISIEAGNIDKESDVYLNCLPIVLEGYHQPSLTKLSLFLMRLSLEVTWTDEITCFHDIAGEIALFYGNLKAYYSEVSETIFKDTISSCIIPACCCFLVIPRSCDTTNNIIFHQIAALEQLYKVFERC